MSEVDGATLVARSLKRQGVNYMFGIVGFPVGPIATAAQKEGITYVGMRNEQSASYAAQAVGYLTGRPGACLVVSGPGVVHALAGLANAQQNFWPMILIGGASESWRNGMGAFQEERQVQIATPFCKFAHAVEHVHRIPFYVEMAVRNSIYGRPGPTYLDLPDDIITGKVDELKVDRAGALPGPATHPGHAGGCRTRVEGAPSRRSGRSSSSARAWPSRAPRTRSARSSSAPSCRSSPRRWARV